MFLEPNPKKKAYDYQDSALKSPLVSICIQTYQHVDYIKMCLDGVLMQQTNFNFEIILGEDSSTDGTREICIDYTNRFPDKIKLFLKSRKDVIYINGQATGRFNLICNLRESQGKYIALCEGDDYWTDPLKLQKQVDYLEANEDVGICFHRANVLKNTEFSLHPIPEPFEKKSFKYIELLRHYNFITTASVVFKKPEVFTFPEWFYKLPFGDMGLYKLVANNTYIHCINETMGVYRVHDQGLYSGLQTIEMKKKYLYFYKLIYSALNSDEQKVVKTQMKNKTYQISKLRFPKNGLMQGIYNRYLRIKL